MNNFTYQLIKDYFYFHVFQPNKNGRKINEPIVKYFFEQVIKNKQKIPSFISNYRKELLQNHNQITIKDFGAGTKKTGGNIRIISDIAKNAASSNRKANFLYNLVNISQPQSIIELGTSLGIGTLSLASGNESSKIYTIEGCESLYLLANEAFRKFGIKNITSHKGNFDIELPLLLDSIISPQIIFIDGNHTYNATLKYLNILIENNENETIIILDDIRWSKEMYAAWLDICEKKEIKLSIDLLDFGIVFLNSKINKQHYRIYY
jgi:predicted O-methyltransferase YrrM